MSWHFIERWLQKVNQHSTLIGKFWITFLIVFRIVVVSSIGDRVYSDEQSEFKCNTQQPGCSNHCFNSFSPISHIRFWSFQIIMVCTPSIIFMVYSAHQTKRKGGKEKGSSNHSPASPEKNRKPDDALAAAASQLKNCPSDEDNSKKKNKRKKSQFERDIMIHAPPRKPRKKDSHDDSKLAHTEHRLLYALSVILRTALEVFFIILQYRLFGLYIPTLYKCEGFPCPNTVDCFVSRPMEKTILLWFMLVISIISFALNIGEIYYMIVMWIAGEGRNACCRKKKRRYTGDVGDITIHDAHVLDGGIVAPRNAPPDYGRISNGDFDLDQFMPGGAYMTKPPIAISVSLNEALAEHHGAQPSAKLVGPTAPLRERDFLMSNPALDQSYANLKRPDQRNGKNPKKGNDFYDYV